MVHLLDNPVLQTQAVVVVPELPVILVEVWDLVMTVSHKEQLVVQVVRVL
jgi:hypothetical protein